MTDREKKQKKKYDIELSDQAKEELAGLPEEDQQALSEAMNQLADDPYIGDRIYVVYEDPLVEELKKVEDRVLRNLGFYDPSICSTHDIEFIFKEHVICAYGIRHTIDEITKIFGKEEVLGGSFSFTRLRHKKDRFEIQFTHGNRGSIYVEAEAISVSEEEEDK